MDSVVVLQARTGSSRLPAKVLLPVAGMPLVVLAARRAGNTGRHVLVATSTDPQDDVLAATLARHGLPCFRGSLHDTLDRMTQAVAGCPDEAVFVRLTADNVLPDGRLIDAIEADFRARDLAYLCCNGEVSGLPYGVSVEVTRVGHLRRAHAQATSAHDREHVMPFLVRQHGRTAFERHKALRKGHLRCTVDVYEDYLEVCRVFDGVPDPVGADVLDLVKRLEGGLYQPVAQAPVPGLVFGAAQLGMSYGVANDTGQPSLSEAAAMLKTAIGNGVAFIDTAHAYGNSEAVIGRSLEGGWLGRVQVLTKLSPMTDVPEQADPAWVAARVDASLYASCARLGSRTLDTVMLHRARHFHAWQSAAWQRLKHHRGEGLVHRLGVSVQTPLELSDALAIPEVELIQMPFNVLDGRWDGVLNDLAAARQERPLLVHVRSALLQGLLTSADAALWRRAHVQDAGPILAWLQQYRDAFGCQDLVELCLRFVRGMPWVDGVVTGMESHDQLLANIRHFNTPPLFPDQIHQMRASRPAVSDATLDPSTWMRA